MQDKTEEQNIDPNCIEAQRRFLLMMKDDFYTRQQNDIRLRAVEMDVSQIKSEVGSVKSEVGSVKIEVDSVKTSIVDIQKSLAIREAFDKRLGPLLDKFEQGMSLKDKAGNWSIVILFLMAIFKILPAPIGELIGNILLKMAG